jgi:hypothetical protein
MNGSLHLLCGDLPSKARLRNESGVYAIIVVDGSGRRVTISRCCKRDPAGIIYIGRSTNLRSRIRTLQRMICPGDSEPAEAGHIFGLTYRRCKKFQKRYPPSRLMFTFRHCAESDTREISLLSRYLDSFGELPPGNATLPRPVVELSRKAGGRGHREH